MPALTRRARPCLPVIGNGKPLRMRTIRKYLTYPNVAATVAVFLAAGAAAWASTGSSSTIHACYKRHGGARRISSRCKHGEKAIRWNQLGPAGPRGASGKTGATGKSGAQGREGKQGSPGVA